MKRFIFVILLLFVVGCTKVAKQDDDFFGGSDDVSGEFVRTPLATAAFVSTTEEISMSLFGLSMTVDGNGVDSCLNDDTFDPLKKESYSYLDGDYGGRKGRGLVHGEERCIDNNFLFEVACSRDLDQLHIIDSKGQSRSFDKGFMIATNVDCRSYGERCNEGRCV